MVWLYKDKEINKELLFSHYGFVYKITNIHNGRMYVGRKYFWQVRKQKNKKRRVKSESNWADYYGSSEDLSADIEIYGKDSFIREIISLHETKGQVNYAEIALQFKLDVLFALDKHNTRIYYNKNIMSRYFAPFDTQIPINNAKSNLYWKSLSEEHRKDHIKNGRGIELSKEMQLHWEGQSQEAKDKLIHDIRENAKKYRQLEKNMID